MRKIALTKVMLAALLASQISIAKPHDSGTYAELNIGSLYRSINFFGYHFSSFDSVGVNGNLGYQFSKYCALEAGYTYFGNGLSSFDGTGKLILPFTLGSQDLSVFAKLGPAYLFKGSNHSVLPYGGLGGSIAINNQLDFTVQGQGLTNGFFSLALVSLGLAYHF